MLSDKRVSWQEFIEKHPNATVEYKYSESKKLARIAASGLKAKLPAGSPVLIKITETVKASDATEGSTITFSVIQDVKIDNNIVVKAGSLGQAQVVAIEEPGRVGKAGKISITDFSVKAVDGTFIPLRGTISGKGSDKVVTSGLLAWVVCPLFLLMKGGDAIVPAGMEKTVYTAADAEVNVQFQ